MESVTLRLTGTSRLLMHAETTLDPFHPDSIALEKAVKVFKKNKTAENFNEQARCEFMAGMYYDDKLGPYMPSWNVFRCLQNAARLTKNGKDVERGVRMVGEKLPLEYTYPDSTKKGPRDREKLWESRKFHDIRGVRVGQAKVQRCRPKFDTWSLDVPILFDTTKIKGREQIIEIATAAGDYMGLGDFRSRWGKFEVSVA